MCLKSPSLNVAWIMATLLIMKCMCSWVFFVRYDVLIKDFIALGQNEASWFPPVSSLCVINPNYLLVVTSHANYIFESGVSLLWLKKANEHVSFYVDFSSVIMINTERCLHTRRAKYSFTLSLLKEPVGFFGWMSPYAASLTHTSCRPETRQKLFSVVLTTCCLCLWGFWVCMCETKLIQH